MRKIGFVVDSTIGDVFIDASVVSLKVNVDGMEYVEGKVDPQIIVKAIQDKKDVKTSQPAPTSFMEAYEEQLDKGYEHVICLTLSGGLSGTINSANLAKDMLESDQVTVIDSGTVHVGAQYIFEKAVELADTGASVDQVVAYINDLIVKGSLIFTVDNLATMVKNGRLSRVQALIGNILRIKPILRFDQGILEVEHKARGIQAVFKYITKQVVEMLDYAKIIVRITYVDNIDYAKEIFRQVKELSNDKIDVEVRGVLSSVISAHVGLGGTGIYLAFEE